MIPVNTFPCIARDESFCETVRHGNDDYPFQYYLEDVWDFDFHCIDWHWHPELEFVYAAQGAVTVMVSGEQRYLPQGFGMFINSRVMHRFTAAAHMLMPNFVFSPALLAPEESLIYQQYIQPLLCVGPPWLLFDPKESWHAEILRLMRMIFKLHEDEHPNRLCVLRLLLEMWEIMYRHIDLSLRNEGVQGSVNHARLQIMLQYIHDHYGEPITLQNIADAIYISKSRALQIFRDGIGQSPIAYLIHYRLQCAATLLRNTEKSVSCIADETGFTSAGYFCRKFRLLFGVSPITYRTEKQTPPCPNKPRLARKA